MPHSVTDGPPSAPSRPDCRSALPSIAGALRRSLLGVHVAANAVWSGGSRVHSPPSSLRFPPATGSLCRRATGTRPVHSPFFVMSAESRFRRRGRQGPWSGPPSPARSPRMRPRAGSDSADSARRIAIARTGRTVSRAPRSPIGHVDSSRRGRPGWRRTCRNGSAAVLSRSAACPARIRIVPCSPGLPGTDAVRIRRASGARPAARRRRPCSGRAPRGPGAGPER